MKAGEIYQFNDPREVFAHIFHEKKKKNPLFSIRGWSRKLGFRNPAQVADVLNGRRNLTVEFGLRVSDSLELGDEEKVYFETLVFLANSRNSEEEKYYSTILRRLKPEDDKVAINPDRYALVKEWYYGVIDEMTCLSDFRADPAYIAKRLDPDVTAHAVSIALNDLIRVGSIKKGPRGTLSRPKKVYFKTREEYDQLEHPILRKYQRKFIERSLIALEEQPRGQSFFRMTNIPIRIRDFGEFRTHIEEFVQKMGRMESAKNADEVYQLGVQFCRITQRQGD